MAKRKRTRLGSKVKGAIRNEGITGSQTWMEEVRFHSIQLIKKLKIVEINQLEKTSAPYPNYIIPIPIHTQGQKWKKFFSFFTYLFNNVVTATRAKVGLSEILNSFSKACLPHNNSHPPPLHKKWGPVLYWDYLNKEMKHGL